MQSRPLSAGEHPTDGTAGGWQAGGWAGGRGEGGHVIPGPSCSGSNISIKRVIGLRCIGQRLKPERCGASWRGAHNIYTEAPNIRRPSKIHAPPSYYTYTYILYNRHNIFHLPAFTTSSGPHPHATLCFIPAQISHASPTLNLPYKKYCSFITYALNHYQTKVSN